MQYTNLIWRDGQPYSELFDDIYYSSNKSEDISGESEFQHVFFEHNGLPERWQGRDDFVIAELGFGSGLNCILTIREWLKHCAECNEDKTLHYIAIEKYPLSPEAIADLILRYPELKPFCDELLESYPPAIEASHSRSLFDNRVVIHFKFMDVADALENDRLNVDAWFLDGFSPAKNPDMWSPELFSMIAQNSRAGATCSTYTSAGFVKRNLQKAGFVVSKVNGYGKKRDMLVAELAEAKLDNIESLVLKYKNNPWFESPQPARATKKEATIVGAGIAGLSLAYALVQRGWTVSIIDKHGNSQKEATSNPAPIVYPRLSINNDIDTEFFTAAYCYALYVFRSLQKKSLRQFWFDDGLLQLMDRKRITQIIKKFKFNSDFVSIADGSIDGVVAGEDGELAVVKYNSAGVVLPAILCDVLKNECGNKLNIIESEVTRINCDDGKWQCFHNSRLIKETEVLIIANGVDINTLGLPVRFPVEAIRGQVVALNESQASRQIKKTLNAEVHITPVINSRHYLGATYTRNCVNREVCESDNSKLLASLNEIYPDVFKEDDVSDAWVGFRAVSKDRVPIVGAVPDASFFNIEYADICHGNTAKFYQPAGYLNGLYISAAHGSRGFTSSFISAEIIASQIVGEPLPVNKKILDYLSPSRFIVNDLKRR
ncbi:MAG: bifunctional tRNA (5-methylaminomethyl-2-thiouridine)(34)-methyltransferase MnmD/FAD-dependent 5-carboxymethylaminomethyl-2-thiouridine(34) oxidoreductase MnmC [Gammaproteobacteria bacterium]|nr:bifunctional tRNA (5-methylaminomethyl-2-thiouridine)(34)-methyltransferase MnmD/FAD-dependent 5-carboxymethylaminomethyl-2-thiouridine(34) oxidoreductase MnmC [Gammaproteobacteria bacterium]